MHSPVIPAKDRKFMNLFFFVYITDTNTPCHDISFRRSRSAKYTALEYTYFQNLFWEVNKPIVQ